MSMTMQSAADGRNSGRAVPLATLGVGVLAVVGLAILGVHVSLEQQALAAAGGDASQLPWTPTPWPIFVLSAVLLAIVAGIELLTSVHDAIVSSSGRHPREDHRSVGVRAPDAQPAHDPLIPAMS